MDNDALSPALRRFLSEEIDNLEQLEVLLLLHAQPARVFGAHEVAQALRLDERSAADALDHLRGRGLLAASGPGFMCAAGAAVATVDELARMHVATPRVVIELMTQQALERLRTSNIRTFAEAFRLRRDKPRGPR